ncbi:MAG: GNAT family N-acetyltransferase [Victivallaceae bacterium]
MAVELRTMQLPDVNALLDIESRIGWNHTDADWRFMINSFPNCCFSAVDGDDVIGSAVSINYQNQVAWIGMVMVDEPYRGQGIAKTLMNRVIDELKTCECIKLDATPAGQLVYEKLGFKPEWSIVRMINSIYNPEDSPPGNAVPVEQTDLNEILAYDAKIFGVDRKILLNRLFDEYPDLAFKTVEKNSITGFCFGREGRNFRQIGPIVAIDNDCAMSLLNASAVARSDRALVVDAVVVHTDFVARLETLGFVAQRPLLRMFLGNNNHPADPAGYFAIPGGEYG